MSWYSDLCEPESVIKSNTPLSGNVPRTNFIGKPKTAVPKKSRSREDHIKVKHAWSMALSPVKSLAVNIFVSYMSGNSLQIVTISMVAYMFFISPINQIKSVGSTFKSVQSKTMNRDIRTAMIVYVAFNVISILFGLWKVNKIGILPTKKADWLPEQPTRYYIN